MSLPEQVIHKLGKRVNLGRNLQLKRQVQDQDDVEFPGWCIISPPVILITGWVMRWLIVRVFVNQFQEFSESVSVVCNQFLGNGIVIDEDWINDLSLDLGNASVNPIL